MPSPGVSRRRLLADGVRAALLWPLAGAALAVACRSREESGGTPAAPPEPAAGTPEPAPTGGDTGVNLVTEVLAMQASVAALQYVHQSARPDQRCGTCLFFSAGSAERGTCKLFAQGLVEAGGWCTSWQARTPS